jgi:hypothetical protein
LPWIAPTERRARNRKPDRRIAEGTQRKLESEMVRGE